MDDVGSGKLMNNGGLISDKIHRFEMLRDRQI